MILHSGFFWATLYTVIIISVLFLLLLCILKLRSPILRSLPSAAHAPHFATIKVGNISHHTFQNAYCVAFGRLMHVEHWNETKLQVAVVWFAAREIPGSNRVANKGLFSRKSLQYAALGTGYTITAVSRSTQPCHPPRDGKWVSTLWLSNNTWRWVNVRPTGELKGQVCSLAYELTATWRWPTFAQRNQS